MRRLTLWAAAAALSGFAAQAEAVCGPDWAPEGAPKTPIAAAAVQAGELRILAVGSSSTAGVGAGSPGAAFTAVLADLLRAQEPNVRVTMVAAGVGGEDALGALKRLPSLLEAETPHLVIWQVGTNDARADKPLSHMTAALVDGAAAVKAADADLVFIDPQHYPDIADPERYDTFVAAVSDAARDAGVAVVPRYQRMRAAALADPAVQMAPDQFHMGAAGHACLARDLAALLAFAASG